MVGRFRHGSEYVTAGYMTCWQIGDDAMPTVTTGYQNISIGRYAGLRRNNWRTNAHWIRMWLCRNSASNQISTGTGNILLGAYTNDVCWNR